MKIFKQPLTVTFPDGSPHGVATVQLQDGAEIMTVGVQGEYDLPVLWFKCDPDAPLVEKTFAIVPTGGEVPSSGFAHYWGTFFQQNATFVWHVFEVR